MSRSVPICVVGVPDGALDRSPLAGGRSLNPRPVDADTARPGRSHSPTSTGSPGSAYRADLRAGRVSCECSMMMTPLHSRWRRSEEHTSELQSLMRISYAVFCLKKKKEQNVKYN